MSRKGRTSSTQDRMLTAEIWRPHPDFDGYQVSTQGRIRSHLHPQARVLKLAVAKNGYLRTGLTRDGRQVNVMAHTCVLLTFIGPPPFEGAQCRHLNGDRLDNRLSNLVWGTGKQNSADARAHGTLACGSRNGKAVLTNDQVIRMRVARAQGFEYKRIATAYGVAVGTAWTAIVGLSYTSLPYAQPHRVNRKAA